MLFGKCAKRGTIVADKANRNQLNQTDMEKIFNQFKAKYNGKSLNEILGCAKHYCERLRLIKDVDEYDDNEFAFIVEWYPCNNYISQSNERIEVECRYSHLTGGVVFTLLNGEVKKFDKTWKIVKNLDLNESVNGSPIWWEVLKMDDGVLWMDNYNGEMAFVENNGRILKTMF